MTKDVCLLPAFTIVVIAITLATSSHVRLPKRSWLPVLWSTSGWVVGCAPRAAVLWFWPMVDVATIGLIWLSDVSAFATFAATVLLGTFLVAFQSAHVFLIRREVAF